MAYWVKKKHNSVNVEDDGEDDVQQDDDDDEFFGNQDGGDVCNDVRMKDPPSASTTAPTSTDLDVAEENSNMNRFQTIGYHEEYDRHKELLLQQGFEDGYSQAFDVAYRIGTILGTSQQQQQQQQTTISGSTDDSTSGGAVGGGGSDSGDAAAKTSTSTILELAQIVRNHLTVVEQEQQSAAAASRSGDETEDENFSPSASSLHGLERTLLEKLELQEEEE